MIFFFSSTTCLRGFPFEGINGWSANWHSTMIVCFLITIVTCTLSPRGYLCTDTCIVWRLLVTTIHLDFTRTAREKLRAKRSLLSFGMLLSLSLSLSLFCLTWNRDLRNRIFFYPSRDNKIIRITIWFYIARYLVFKQL